ncbi:MAG TPA: 6-phosphogluconolactonase [Egibacteraceae bacterium]|nr:6-phosphogluconolactonase [Egibacteraceae bacterium]
MRSLLRIRVVDDKDLAERTAEHIAELITGAVSRRGRCVAGFSGGSTPEPMMRSLADRDLPWPQTHLVQVDERIAPSEHPDRNAGLLRMLADLAGVPASNVHLMPVTSQDLHAACGAYAALVASLSGGDAVALDVAHLGLGEDGHTASLVPGDPVLAVEGADVAVTGPYQGRRRMTLTLPALNRSAAIVWQVAGAGKAEALRMLLNGGDIPAARIRRDRAVVIADASAAQLVSP